MSMKRKDLKPYFKAQKSLIPVHQWNKKIKGKERGKTPRDKEWTSKKYENALIKKLAGSGLNVGFRITERDIVIDMDPRNYNDVDIESEIAELFDVLDFQEIFDTYPGVKTGGGGYHIYCRLPNGTNIDLLREVVEPLPGVEFKKQGKQVLCAGCRHPNGEFYRWHNQIPLNKAPNIPKAALKMIKRKKLPKRHESGEGTLNGSQLAAVFLDHLDIGQYSTNDLWFPMLCASHHVTGGTGIDEFIAWSIGDGDYSGDENDIRIRWESLTDSGDNDITVGSLLMELESNGGDVAGAKAVLSFSSKEFLSDFDDLDFEDFDEEDESAIASGAKDAADQIDISELLDLPEGQGGNPGEAIAAAKKVNKGSSFEQKMICLRYIKAAPIDESLIAQEILVDGKTMKQGMITKLLKTLDEKVLDSIVETLATVTLKATFKDGKHIILEPNGQLWTFKKTHWFAMSDEYLEGILYRVVDTLKQKMEIKGVEIVIAGHARKAIRARRAVLISKIHRPEKMLPIVNCKNCEVWINPKTGIADRRDHNYRSYQTRKLNVVYDPTAECPLFMRTLKEIFADQKDCDEMVRHMGEILGYTIQPYKPDANWWLFRGDGGDGKSTILKVLEGILGASFLNSSTKILSIGNASSNPHAVNSLEDKLAVVIEELPTGYTINDAGVKLLSENKTMEANPKGNKHYNFGYVGSLFMCSNYYPKIKGTKQGDLRRYNIIPFNQQFDKRKVADLDRASKILNSKKEMAGVLNFLLKSFENYVFRGEFDVPESCQRAKELWLVESNNVARFIDENIVKTVNSAKICKATELYVNYVNWCDTNGLKFNKGRNAFYGDLVDLGFDIKVGRANAKYIHGGELIDTEFDDFDENDAL